MYEEAVEILKNSHRTVAFTGAGISVESGIPPFRGENGLWNKYDPIFIEINYFQAYPKKSWKLIKEIFFDFFGKAKPNPAHKVLAKMEEKGLLQAIITQNIDNMHQEAGSKVVYEFHGNSQYLICLKCKKRYPVSEIDLTLLPPKCKNCNELLKPDFVFFGEGIPKDAYENSFAEAYKAEVFIVIGTTGEVMPACTIPYMAKRYGATIIEVNTNHSAFTNQITDIFLQGKAGKVMSQLAKELGL